MPQTIAPSTPAPRGLVARVVGVVTSPRATFASVAAHPRWADALGLVLLVLAAGSLIFFSTRIGREAFVDQQIKSLESFGRLVTDEQYRRFERFAPLAGYAVAATELVALPLIGLGIAAVAFGVFNARPGGDASFRQVFAVVAHSGVLIALQQTFVLPLDYLKQSLSSPTALNVFFPFLDEDSFAGRLLGSIDLFVVWWTVTLAIGLAVLYKRRTRSVAAALLAIYTTIALVMAGIKSALSGA